jgi:hypothetical protein
MSIQSAVDQAGRVFGDLHRQTRNLLANKSSTDEPAPSELWDKVSPQLEKALAIYERKESPDTRESSWIPGRTRGKAARRTSKKFSTPL